MIVCDRVPKVGKVVDEMIAPKLGELKIGPGAKPPPTGTRWLTLQEPAITPAKP